MTPVLVVAGLCYVVMIGFLGQPVYMLLLTYLLLILCAAYIFRANIYTYISNAYMMSGDLQKAKRALDLANKHGTKNAVALSAYGAMLLREGSYAKAVEPLEKALSLRGKNMTDVNTLISLGSAYWATGEFSKAAEAFEKVAAVSDKPDASLLLSLGFLYMSLGDTQKAEEKTLFALEQNAPEASVHETLGLIAYKNTDFDRAETELRLALSQNSNLVDSNFVLGLICETKGDEKSARYCYDKAEKCEITPLNFAKPEQIKAKTQVIKR